jgi:DNA polymerase III subunit gamma/tau
MKELHIKYRPERFEDVIGQDAVVRSLCGVLRGGTCRSFLFTGPSGVGKTTLARLVASTVGALENNVREVDGATNTGIDAMREITRTLQYRGLGESSRRVLIIDEAHALSKAAWQSLLKGIEEPPSHVYWCLCTTEPSKVPETIKTRCVCYNLTSVKRDAIAALLERVVKAERLETPESVLATLVEFSQGSPRRALTYLAQVAQCKDEDDAIEVLNRVKDESAEVIDLCRALQRRAPWRELARLLDKFEGKDAEGLRINITRYFIKVAVGARDEKKAGPAIEILDAFSEPCNSNDGLAPIVVACGRVLL